MVTDFCSAWEPQLMWLTILAHAANAFAYFGIPFMLLATAVSRMVIVLGCLLAMFAAFIFACGTGHLLEILTLWYPFYWTTAIETVVTGLISFATLYLLPIGILEIQKRHKATEINHELALRKSTTTSDALLR
jgi:hypothetical protein